MNFSAWSIRNPIPSILLFIVLTVAGLMAFRTMKIQNFPDIDLPTVIVTASLPGAAPGQLENDVARKLENSIATLQGVKHIYTKVQDGTGEKFAGCVKDETAARDNVAAVWSLAKPATRQTCAGEEGAQKSYVDLVTCMQLYEGNLPWKK